MSEINYVERPQITARTPRINHIKQALVATVENQKALQLSGFYRSSYSQYQWFKERGLQLKTRTVKQLDGSKVLVGWCEKVEETKK